MLGELYFALSILELFGIAVKAGGGWEIQPPSSRITHRAAYLASGTGLQKIPRLASLSCITGNWISKPAHLTLLSLVTLPDGDLYLTLSGEYGDLGALDSSFSEGCPPFFALVGTGCMGQAIKPAYHRQSTRPFLSFHDFLFPVPFLLSAAPINPAYVV